MRMIKKIMSMAVSRMAISVTSGMVNSACYIFMYQPKLPEGAEELYKA